MELTNPTQNFESLSDVLHAARSAYAGLPDEAHLTDLEGLPNEVLREGKYIEQSYWLQLGAHVLPLALLVTGFIGTFFITNNYIPIWLMVLGVCCWPVSRWIANRAARRFGDWRGSLGVHTAAIVQVNSELLSMSEHELAAACLVVTFDPALEVDRPRLLELAERLSHLDDSDDAAFADVSTFLNGNSNGVMFRRVQVPPSLAGNERTFMIDHWIHRDALPLGYIDRGVWFLLAREGFNESAVLPPTELWWNESADLWMNAGRPAS